MSNTSVRSLIESASASSSTGCQGCRYHTDCGGLPDQNALWGCFTDCETVCRHEKCDWTCPARPDEFVNRWREVGGLPPRPVGTLKALLSLELPSYIPMIQHGKRRDVPLDLPIVAIPTFRAVRRLRGGRYGIRALDAMQLRQEFQLAANTRILFVSVALDRHLEAYWKNRNVYNVPARLAELDVIGMTIPNFSFFADAPRTHTLWNRARMTRVAEELSQAGIGVVPHLNALTENDWNFWARLLKAQPQLLYVAKEFQTGLAHKEIGLKQLEGLRRLQDKIGRELHPIMVGATRFVRELAKGFRHFTLVDSKPFMATMYRCAFAEGECQSPRMRQSPTPPGEPLDAMLMHNIQQHSAWIQKTMAQPTNASCSENSDTIVPLTCNDENQGNGAQTRILY